MTLRSLLAGRDGPTKRALPAGEFLHPVPLAALLLLVANDWWLKPSDWAPGQLTGKLSDFAGLLFFPLLLTALANCLGLALHRLGLPLDFTLRRYKSGIAIGLTALCFSLVKLSPAGNQLALQALEAIGMRPRIVLDPTDLVALPILLVSWRVAMGELARIPLGRLELIEAGFRKNRVGVGAQFDDTIVAGAPPLHVAELAEAFEEFLATGASDAAMRTERALAELRDLSLPAP